MSEPAAPAADPNRIRQYLAVVEQGVVTCAGYRGGRGDVFLWHARRTAEAVLYALAEGTAEAVALQAQARAPAGIRHSELQRRLSETQRLPQHISPYLDQMRVSGQLQVLGPQPALASLPQEVTDRATLDACVRAIPVVIRWLYAESAVARKLPSTVADALKDLESPTARVPPDYRLDKELQDLRAEADLLRQDRANLRRALGLDEVTGQPVGTPNRLTAGQIGVVAAVVALLAAFAIGRFTAGSSVAQRTDARSAAAALPPKSSSASQGASAPPVPPAALATASEAAHVAAPEASPPAALNQAATPVQAVPQQQPGPAASAASEAAAPQPVDPAPAAAPPCADGQLLVTGGRVDLGRGPYPRPAWPVAAQRPPTSDVPAFCIDMAAVDAADLRAWVEAAGPAVAQRYPARRAWAAGRPAERVAWRDAVAYCESKGGALPTVAQWEASVRQEVAPSMSPLKGEWSADAFPAPVFGYAEAQLPKCGGVRACPRVVHEGLIATPRIPGPRLRWVFRPAGAPSPSIGFRCAGPVSGSPAAVSP